ncbi:hypothetical protein AAFC00_005355 [Neodothiora populina]|uniref:Uncharacterized protein n=1 Tax=Neodothiora populina TaxID=2781224 RepID=A0ABR3PLP6_9PEZI
MAPTLLSNTLLPRYIYGYNNCYYGNCTSSRWSSWGRWVLLGCLIAAAIILFFLFSCLTARRRRRQGYAPYRGTGWALAGHGPAQYTSQPHYGNGAQPMQQQRPYYNNSNNPPPPPAYTPPANQSYYGNNPNIELQQPETAYSGQYAPPKDPPPHVVR